MVLFSLRGKCVLPFSTYYVPATPGEISSTFTSTVSWLERVFYYVYSAGPSGQDVQCLAGWTGYCTAFTQLDPVDKMVVTSMVALE
ncbi:hypothetical protein BaRGS_00003043 [Batillaria attramentaria]|uniref:Uncharacterized protein n=1 Tax=Batillaria attramentaria TaxID=370345 RepID=A0ABD0M235_9CAEN